MTVDLTENESELRALLARVQDARAEPAQRLEALAMLARAADAGNPLALALRGSVAARGTPDVPVDHGQALGLLERAQALGEPSAAWRLAEVYDAHGDLERAFALTQASADAGDSVAQFMLAQKLRLGRGCGTDLPRAALLARRSMEAGCVEGKLVYAKMLKAGEGMTANRADAMRLMEEAWDAAGTADAALMLGWAHCNDEVDLVEARKWFVRAAEAGSAQARDEVRWVDFQRAFEDLDRLEIGGGEVRFQVHDGVLEAAVDRTTVVGSSSNSSTSGTVFEVGSVGMVNGSTQTHTTVHRRYDVGLTILCDSGDRLTITMNTEAAHATGMVVGQRVSALYAARGASGNFHPVAVRSQRTGRAAFVRDGVPPDVQTLLAGRVVAAFGWGFAAFMAFGLGGQDRPLLAWPFSIGAGLWCSLKAYRAATHGRRMRKRYFAQVRRILALEDSIRPGTERDG